MPTKTEIQEAVPVNHNFTALLWATSSGKTGAALRLIAEKLKTDKTPWVILTSETMNIESIKQEAVARGYGDIIDRVEIYCYHSLHKVVERHNGYNLLLDEAQTLFTELRLGHLKNLNPKQVIVTTATLYSKQLFQIADIFKFRPDEMFINKRSLTLNMEDGILPEPEILEYPVKFRDREKKYTFVLKAGGQETVIVDDISARWDRYKEVKGKKGGWRLELKCTDKEYYDALTKDIEYTSKQIWKSKEASRKFLRLKVKRLGLERARLLADIKEDKVIEITNAMKEKDIRYLAFAYSIDAAEKFSDNAISSRRKNNDETLDKFNRGLIDNLSAFRMLNAGVNLTNIEQVVFQHLERSEFNFIQKIGRGLRSDNPVIHLVYVPGTTDEKNMRELMINLS